jgi:hypothetical protein
MAKRTTTPEVPASPPVTFGPNHPLILAMVAEAVQAALNAQRAEQAAKPGKSDQSTQNELKAISAFKKKGFGIVKPKIDVLTFNKWVEQGLRPKEGEHSVPVANLRLFHRSQCRELTAEEKAGFKTKNDERVAAAKAKIVSITEAGAQQ